MQLYYTPYKPDMTEESESYLCKILPRFSGALSGQAGCIAVFVCQAFASPAAGILPVSCWPTRPVKSIVMLQRPAAPTTV